MCDAGQDKPFDGWRLSLGDTALNALYQFLETHSQIDNLVVDTDNDEAGEQAAEKIADLANGSDIKVTRSRPPIGKDWNISLLAVQKRERLNNREPAGGEVCL